MNQIIESIFSTIKKQEMKFVDFRFTTTTGRFSHVTYHADAVDHNILANGISFDGSSIKGWKSIEKSDMLLKPDLSSKSSIFFDQFSAHPTISIICDVIDVEKNSEYNRDPRSIARKAEIFLKNSGIADIAYFGAEIEFLVFDDVRYAINQNGAFFSLDSAEGLYNAGRKYEYNNQGQRYGEKDWYFASSPNDNLNDIRSEIVETLKAMNVDSTLHHHEVAASQCEVGFKHGTILEVSDNVQKCKNATLNVVSSYGKSATFMPKVTKNDNGNGMHIHQSLFKDGKNLFASGENDNKISDLCKWYIGGIIKHARAIAAFTNPTTNSYKRLIPGYEAPVFLVYSNCNRSAAIRIPHVPGSSEKERRIEARFPDPAANPYLANSAILMAGIDGIRNKIDPGNTVDENVFETSNNTHSRLPKNLEEAINALDKDRTFLTEGNVFTDDQIDGYLQLLKNDHDECVKHPTPIEFIKYYSV